MKLESVGRIIAGGWGDRVLIGILMGFLDGITPARAYEYIRDNLRLGYWISDNDWGKYRRMAKGANVADINREKIISELRKHSPDILRVIIMNQPESLTWLDNQIAEIKKKLGVG